MKTVKGISKIVMVSVGLCLSCASEKQVDITLLSSARDDALVVEDDYIELAEGQAIGIQVEALDQNEAKPQWTVTGASENQSIVELAETDDPGVFVVIGKRKGSTELRFELRGKDLVFIPITVRAREEWNGSPLGGASSR